MAFVTSKPTAIRTRPNRRPTDSYSTALRTRVPRTFDVWDFPTGTLQGLGDTGIPFLDARIASATGKVDEVATALRISTACTVASLGISIFMLIRSLRR
jgi:hypothetical protein